jgi:hypothetical protein
VPKANIAISITPDKDSPAVSCSPKAVPEHSPIQSVHRSSNSIKPKLLGPIASTSAIASASGSNAGKGPVLRQLLEEEDEDMAPTSRRELLHKDHFAFVFGSVKTQNYLDPVSKGPGSHT